MRRNLLSIAFAVMVIGLSLLVRGALLSKMHYGEAHAALTASRTLLSESETPQTAESTVLLWNESRAVMLKSIPERPHNLLKISSGDVMDLLHEPELMRVEHKMQMWQYRTASCVLDLYLQDSGEVTHYEMRARDSGVADIDIQHTCIGDLVTQAMASRMVDMATSVFKTASSH